MPPKAGIDDLSTEDISLRSDAKRDYGYGVFQARDSSAWPARPTALAR
jgi:hypothetical protein